LLKSCFNKWITIVWCFLCCFQLYSKL